MSRSLRIQLGLTALGAGVWYAGAFLEREFVSGIGVGILIGALAIRFLRS